MNDDLQARVAAALAALGCAPPYAVAFSGGADSTALLALVPAARALHVNHRLHADSGAWAAQAEAVALALKRPFIGLTVTVAGHAAGGLEAAARAARYAALGAALHPGETLLTAHHAEDQSETLLLRLLRGAGLPGLRGIAGKRPFGDGGWLARPLLEIPQKRLHAHVATLGLPTLKDPANQDLKHDRNFLRLNVLPTLRSRWPQLDQQFAHSIAALDGAHALLQARCLPAAGQPLSDWQALDARALSALLASYIASLGLRRVSARGLNEFARQLFASESAQPSLDLKTHRLCRYRDSIYAIAKRPPLPPLNVAFDGRAQTLPGGWGQIALTPPADAARAALTLRHLRGSEQIRMRAQGPNRLLRLLFQEHAVPPWQRVRLPLIYQGDTLIGVATLLESDALKAWLDGAQLLFTTSAAAARPRPLS